MKIKFNDKVYDILKWLCLIVLPAVSVLYCSLAAIYGLPYASEISQTINAIIVFIGALIGLSTASYKEGTEDGQ